jgi:Family of unknown function (DUF6491)
MEHRILLTVAALGTLQACANLETTSSDGVNLRKEETSIYFANQRSAVHTWQADGREGLWIQDGRKDWYYASFIGPCFGIENSIRLGFDTGTSDKLDRFSYVIVPEEDQRCAIGSFTRSDPPPQGKRRNLANEEVK